MSGKKIKVLISKREWIEATTNIKGRFYCPIKDQYFLLNVWPDDVPIELLATPKKGKK